MVLGPVSSAGCLFWILLHCHDAHSRLKMSSVRKIKEANKTESWETESDPIVEGQDVDRSQDD